MKIFLIFMLLCSSLFIQSQERALTNTSQSPHAKLSGFGMGDVQWTKGFWAERFA